MLFCIFLCITIYMSVINVEAIVQLVLINNCNAYCKNVIQYFDCHKSLTLIHQSLWSMGYVTKDHWDYGFIISVHHHLDLY